MRLGEVIGDATSGALYNIEGNELWVSFDYGMNWEYRQEPSYEEYWAGQNPGTVFKLIGAELSQSDNY